MLVLMLVLMLMLMVMLVLMLRSLAETGTDSSKGNLPFPDASMINFNGASPGHTR